MSSTLPLVFCIASLVCACTAMISPKLVTPSYLKNRHPAVVVGFYMVWVVVFAFFYGANTARQERARANANAAVIADAQKPPLDPIARLEAEFRKQIKSTTVGVMKTPDGSLLAIATYAPKSTWNEEFFVKGAGLTLIEVGALAKDSGLPFKTIQLHAVAPSTDAYGNSSVSSAFTLAVAEEDFQKINWGGISIEQMLNLVEVEPTPFGKKVASIYCRGAEPKSRPVLFCINAT